MNRANERLQYVAPDVTPILQYVRNPFGFYKDSRRKPGETHHRGCRIVSRAAQPAGVLVSDVQFFQSEIRAAQIVERLDFRNRTMAWRAMHNRGCHGIFYRVYSLRNNENAPDRGLRGKAMRWFERADMLVMHNGSPYAVKEGLGAHVYPDGTHMVLSMSRPDARERYRWLTIYTPF